MKLIKTIFFEIPSKDFIIPISSEEQVNTLKSFIKEEVCFSIGYKSVEDQDGWFYIGKMKSLTELFSMNDFPVIFRKRVSDTILSLNSNPQEMIIENKKFLVKYIVYFYVTKDGLKTKSLPYNETSLNYLKKWQITDYLMKEIEVLIPNRYQDSSDVLEEEVFYKIKNMNA